jgi:nitrogenase molybdenum-iron protein alpha/beta subunit
VDILDLEKRVQQLDQLAEKYIRELDTLLDAKIDKIRELLNGISVSVQAQDVKKAKPAEQ